MSKNKFLILITGMLFVFATGCEESIRINTSSTQKEAAKTPVVKEVLGCNIVNSKIDSVVFSLTDANSTTTAVISNSESGVKGNCSGFNEEQVNECVTLVKEICAG